jgi:hypothetical protein
MGKTVSKGGPGIFGVYLISNSIWMSLEEGRRKSDAPQ